MGEREGSGAFEEDEGVAAGEVLQDFGGREADFCKEGGCLVSESFVDFDDAESVFCKKPGCGPGYSTVKDQRIVVRHEKSH